MKTSKFVEFDDNALISISQPDLAGEMLELESSALELIGGGIDGSCGNNSVCGSEIDTYCIDVNAVCQGPNYQCQNPTNNIGCTNVGCA